MLLSALSLHSIMGFRTVITLPPLFALSVHRHCTAALGEEHFQSELLFSFSDLCVCFIVQDKLYIGEKVLKITSWDERW